MNRGPPRTGPEGLLERSDELNEIELLLAGAQATEGRGLVIEGEAGIGKTALLDAARQLGQRRGMTVLAARGGELEGNFPFGVVRQLFEASLHRATPEARAQLLSGSARLAEGVLDPAAESRVPREGFGQLHGLFWLTVNLSASAPVLVVVDDLHWADPRSLRFLLYLASRLEGLPIAVLGAIRPPATPAARELTSQVMDERLMNVIRPAALSPGAIVKLLAAGLGQKPEDAFVDACAVATGGVPFLVLELVAALAADTVEPSASNAAAVLDLGPQAVARATIVRLARMPVGCLPLARAIAVLGPEANLPRATRLAGLEETAALGALDALVGASVVRANGRLEFVHPILRRAIYEELPPGTRSQLHRQAAALLTGEGAQLDSIAAQLVASEPTGSAEVIDQLRDAARAAIARGGPEAAVAYLTRALAEGGERDARAAICFELATAERSLGQPVMIEHFREAQRSAEDVVLRNLAALELASALSLVGEHDAPLAVLEAALAELGDEAPELGLRLEGLRSALSAADPRLVGEFDRRLPRLEALLEHAGPSVRSLALLLSAVSARRGEDPARVLAFAERGWDEGRVVEDGGDIWALGQALAGLIITDHLERAGEMVDALQSYARTHGSLARFALGSAYRGFIEVRGGSLTAAEAALRVAIEPSPGQRAKFALCNYLWIATDVFLERPESADLAGAVEELELGPLAATLTGALLLEVRGRLRHAAGAPGATQDMRAAGAIVAALGHDNPNGSSWRSGLALMLPASEADEALALARSELEAARRVGYPRAIGIALRALGVLEGGAAGRAYLVEAVDALEGSSARLELARALVELGASQRRAGERSASREPLRAGLDIAAEVGAVCLADRARQELQASGAHPRRERVTGRDALTPSELRVARLAAAGHTNHEIAQALFVTPKTIDTHLSHAYAKLGISSRRDLADALEAEVAPAEEAALAT